MDSNGTTDSLTALKKELEEIKRKPVVLARNVAETRAEAKGAREAMSNLEVAIERLREESTDKDERVTVTEQRLRRLGELYEEQKAIHEKRKGLEKKSKALEEEMAALEEEITPFEERVVLVQALRK